MKEFEKLSEFERNLLDGIKANAKGLSKECIFNAIEHLKMAYKIKELDSSMALFRVITAEEEVSRAIFLILKEQNYKNNKKIKYQDHNYKQSLPFFIGMVQEFFYSCSKEDSFPFERNIKLEFNNKMILKLKIPLKKENKLLSTEPPLNFLFLVNGKSYNFNDEIISFINKSEFKEFKNFINDKSNTRNTLLYA